MGDLLHLQQLMDKIVDSGGSPSGTGVAVKVGSLKVWVSVGLFVRLISHQPTVLFSQNKPATSNQPAVLFSQNKSAPTISHQPNEQAASFRG
jgi:hypothetical protein